jgi:hypothetical protein
MDSPDKRRMMFMVSLLLIGIFTIRASEASDWSVPVGLGFEHNFYTQFGVCASVSHKNILGGHPQATLFATTSRLGAIAGNNVLKNENWLLTAAWHFRPGTYVDPFAGIDLGVVHFDRENEKLFSRLHTTAPMFNIRVGIAATVWGDRLRPLLDGGFAVVQSSTVFPLFFGAKLSYDVMKGGL